MQCCSTASQRCSVRYIWLALFQPNFMIPRKRKPQKKPVFCQRTLLPKIPSSQVILVPHNVQQSVMQTVQPVMSQEMLHGLQSMTQQTDIAMGTIVSTMATLCSVQEVDAGMKCGDFLLLKVPSKHGCSLKCADRT